MRRLNLKQVFFTFLMICVTNVAHAKELFYEPMTQNMLEESLFGNNPSGCINRINFFAMTLNGYKNSEAIEEMINMKVLQPLIKKNYDSLREKGVVPSMEQAMRDFQDCAEKFPALEAQEQAAFNEFANNYGEDADKFKQKYKPRHNKAFERCGAMNAIALTALDGVKQDIDKSIVEIKAVAIHMDTEGTIFKEAKEPEKLLVGNIYDANKEGGYDRAIELSYSTVMQCFATTR